MWLGLLSSMYTYTQKSNIRIHLTSYTLSNYIHFQQRKIAVETVQRSKARLIHGQRLRQMKYQQVIWFIFHTMLHNDLGAKIKTEGFA